MPTKVGPLARKHRLPLGNCHLQPRFTEYSNYAMHVTTAYHMMDASGPHRFLCFIASVASSPSLDVLYPLILSLASTSTTSTGFSTISSTSIADLASVILPPCACPWFAPCFVAANALAYCNGPSQVNLAAWAKLQQTKAGGPSPIMVLSQFQ